MWLNKLLTVDQRKGWKTEKFHGVKGGRARLILVDTQVCEFIQNTPAFHNTPMLLEAEEPLAEYAPGIRTPAIGKSSAQ